MKRAILLRLMALLAALISACATAPLAHAKNIDKEKAVKAAALKRQASPVKGDLEEDKVSAREDVIPLEFSNDRSLGKPDSLGAFYKDLVY